MKTKCPNCRTIFRVDPRKVPEGGARARCSICQNVFYVAPANSAAAESRAVASPAMAGAGEARSPADVQPPASSSSPTSPPAPQSPSAGAFPFGITDPQAKARRLARALVSDMVTYHPERRDQSLREGTLKQEFKDEIRKSWEEYVGQVGIETAHGSSHFRDALNEILARGERVF